MPSKRKLWKVVLRWSTGEALVASPKPRTEAEAYRLARYHLNHRIGAVRPSAADVYEDERDGFGYRLYDTVEAAPDA